MGRDFPLPASWLVVGKGRPKQGIPHSQWGTGDPVAQLHLWICVTECWEVRCHVEKGLLEMDDAESIFKDDIITTHVTDC